MILSWQITTDLEPLVLQDLLDGDILSVFRLGNKLGLKDDAEGTIADNFAIRIRYVTGLAALAIGSNDFDHLSGIVDG
jgi:hypothetical protein